MNMAFLFNNITLNKTIQIKLSSPLRKSRLYTVMYASHHGSDDRFCRSLESAIRHNVHIHLLGWQIPWKGLSQKLEAAYKFANSIFPDDVLLFTDAYDVLFFADETAIIKNFNELNSSLIFGAECGCWPHVAENPAICLHDYPLSPTSARYLNSGTWIGHAGKASSLLKTVIQEAGGSFENANDQKLIADMYITHRHDIKLDFYSKIFQSLHLTLDAPLKYCEPRKNLVLINGSKWWNRETNSYPCLFHFNGGGKRYHLEMEGAMRYKQHRDQLTLNNVAKSLILLPDSIGGSRSRSNITYGEICADYLRQEYKFVVPG